MSEYLRPKVAQKSPETVKRVNGQFVNVDSYIEIGKMTAKSMGKANPSLALEKGGPTAEKGKPI